ncbi:MAG: hypothetical protein B6D61_12285 [Bacteroidetes bacterium 4484_249]|nr:MAG: hypothetical protein B6D61_12285 [Bacteroidetes bacterium 4484_249]
MKNEDNINDDFLKRLVRKADIEKPSIDFTQNVMKEIEVLSQKETISTSIINHLNMWYFIAASGLFALGYLTYYFINSGKSFISQNYDPVIIPVFENILLSFKGLFQSFQISSFTLVIIGAVVFLFVLDRLLRKFQVGKYFYFSF